MTSFGDSYMKLQPLSYIYVMPYFLFIFDIVFSFNFYKKNTITEIVRNKVWYTIKNAFWTTFETPVTKESNLLVVKII